MPQHRPALTAAIALALLAASAPSASAAARSGSVKDAKGEIARDAPGLDVVSARFETDGRGAVLVSATMAGPFGSPTSARVSPIRFEVFARDARGLCNENVFSPALRLYLTADGALAQTDKPVPATKAQAVIDGPRVTLGAQVPALAGQDLVCMRVVTTAGSDSSSAGIDQAFVSAPGFGRDGDRDGRADPDGPLVLLDPRPEATASRVLRLQASAGGEPATATISLRTKRAIRLPGAARAAIVDLGRDAATLDVRRGGTFQLRLSRAVQAYLDDRLRLPALATVRGRLETGETFVRRLDVVVLAPGEGRR